MLQCERCLADPERELERTYSFLALEPVDHVPDDLELRRGRRLGRAEISDALRADLVAALAPDVVAVARELPEIDLGLWPNFSTAERS